MMTHWFRNDKNNICDAQRAPWICCSKAVSKVAENYQQWGDSAYVSFTSSSLVGKAPCLKPHLPCWSRKTNLTLQQWQQRLTVCALPGSCWHSSLLHNPSNRLSRGNNFINKNVWKILNVLCLLKKTSLQRNAKSLAWNLHCTDT